MSQTLTVKKPNVLQSLINNSDTLANAKLLERIAELEAKLAAADQPKGPYSMDKYGNVKVAGCRGHRVDTWLKILPHLQGDAFMNWLGDNEAEIKRRMAAAPSRDE